MALLPSGVFAESYAADRALVRTGKQWVALGLFVAFLFVLPLIFGTRLTAIGNGILITAIVVVGLQITMGYAGQITLGQAAFMGVGAFAAAALARAGAPFWLCIPLGGVAAAVFGLLFGIAAARIKGFYLALTTIAAQFVFQLAIVNLPTDLFGGSHGLSVPAASIGSLRLTTETSIYYLNLIVCIIMVCGAFGIVRSRYGRAFVAVREDDVAAGILGINVVGAKVLAFLIGAFYAGVGGALWASYIRFISVEQFTLFNSIWMIAMIIIGGIGSIVGAIVGSVVVRGLQELVTALGPVLNEVFPAFGGQLVFAGMNLVLGGLITFFLIVEPKGLMHRWNKLKQAYRLWPYPHA
ncbi:branched-chain amino acid ABC transporter permease [Mesorhizobium microcysteis]|uniref:Branched-chain amino acid ABC transporter permease n=1 Tax=Neoaquamicrobium microcysteis TaxID=2682781 RepID=A0A5D4H3Z6_9HYPH|nr:branched-chain amino acid ABC transporter permease [Mesorhizobium microcysteis]TYR33530.1 branched-chain amino acid ABC transporter permease [Mesorhizobium microcysteis]